MDSQLIFDSSIENPLVTIAIPTYKRNEMLVEAINSALNQDTNIAYDVLVVDNNPERNDSTEQAMRLFEKNPKVAYYKNEQNVGMAGNWNRLYPLSKGKYVTMLHDDDLLFPYYLKVVQSLLMETNYKYELIYPSLFFSNERILPDKELPTQMRYRHIKRKDYLTRQWGIPSGMMILKSKFQITNGFKMDYYPINDQEFIYRALGYLKGCVVSFPLVFYYIGENESMRPDTANKIVSQSKRFNVLIRKDKKNPWRLLTYLTYRYQINSISDWVFRLTNSEDIVKSAKENIGFKKNKIKDSISYRFVELLNRYLVLMHCHYFNVSK